MILFTLMILSLLIAAVHMTALSNQVISKKCELVCFLKDSVYIL